MINYIEFAPTIINWIYAINYSLLTLLSILFFKKYWRINPMVWYSVFQWIIAFGSILLVDLSIESHRFYMFLFFYAYIIYMITAIFLWQNTSIKNKYNHFFYQPLRADNFDSMILIKVLCIISIIVTVYYFSQVGYNIFVNIILGIAIEDYSTMRLQSYSGDKYVAAGYVNQFKNVLLPVTTSIICSTYLLKKQYNKFYFFSFIGLIFCSVALLGTGQRAFFAYSLAALIFGIAAYKDLKIKSLVLPLALAFTIFSLMSSFYKIQTIDENEDIILESFAKSFERFFYTEQEGSLTSYEYLHDQDKVYMREFLDQLRGVVPGQKGSDLEHLLFSLRHKTTRGTETYATVAGFYYNGGIFAVTIFFIMLASLHHYIFHSFLNGIRSPVRIFAYAALIFYTSKLVSGSILTLFNSGVFTLVLLLLICNINLGFKNIFFTEKRMLNNET